MIITFTNRLPIRIPESRESEIKTIWDGNQDFGHNKIISYDCKNGKKIFWHSYNSGMFYGNHEPKTKRSFLKNLDAVREIFQEDEEIFNSEVSHLIDPSIILEIE